MDPGMFRGLDKVLYVLMAITVIAIGGGGILCGRHSMSKYKEKWEAGQKNEKFWSEVMVGKKITEIKFHDDGLDSFVLDSGEEVFIHKNEHGVATLMIKD